MKGMVAKLRSIFRAHGRLARENPAAHPEIQRYFTCMREEQAIAAVGVDPVCILTRSSCCPRLNLLYVLCSGSNTT